MKINSTKTGKMKTPDTKEEIILLLQGELPNLRHQYGVQQLALYGSFAKGRHKRASDVDILVSLAAPLGLRFIALVQHLEALLGRKVEVTTFENLQTNRTNTRYQQKIADIEGSLLHVST